MISGHEQLTTCVILLCARHRLAVAVRLQGRIIRLLSLLKIYAISSCVFVD